MRRAEHHRGGLTLVQSRILDEIWSRLRACPDFHGAVEAAFKDLVELTVRFVADRQDMTRETAGARGRYLFAWAENEQPPHEKALQADYRDFLAGSIFGARLQVEARDIGGGRVDVRVGLDGFQFVAEIKRAFDDTGRDGARKYLGQTATYLGTNVRLGLLLVLDLTPKPTGTPALENNIWVEAVSIAQDPSDLRHVVVFRVAGNRVDPSATAAPAAGAHPQRRKPRRGEADATKSS